MRAYKPHIWTDQYQPSAMFGSVLALSGIEALEFARAVREAEVDFVLGSRIEKTLIGGMGIAHHAIGSSYYFNTFRYLPVPYVGYEGILYLLQELGLVMEDMFHEREAWKKLRYKNI